MTQKIYQVDAFTHKPFAGNPAAVVILPEPRDEIWMQNVATEMNLSETAYLHKIEDGYHLRWFTPACEVELCGHATLASAHTLWEAGELNRIESARFHTLSGLLTAEYNNGWIEMNFPATPDKPDIAPPGLDAALGVTPTYVGKTRFDYLVVVASEETVRSMKPDFTALKEIPIRGVTVTSLSSDSEFDFVSRFFAPGAGIDEDPVTGSAHCCLGPYWRRQLDKDEFLAYQASKRGGVVRVRVAGERVYLGGQAVTVLEGNLLT